MVKKQVEWILADRGNAYCADCTASEPQWAILNFHMLVCINCAGVHRKMGAHISKVRSIVIDDLDDRTLDEFHETNNSTRNSDLEFYVPAKYRKPRKGSAAAIREEFIRAKYETLEFDRSKFPESALPLHPIFADPEPEDAKDSGKVSELDKGSVAFGGLLMAKLIAGKSLKAGDITGFSDPYVLLSNGVHTMKSKKKKRTLNPKWDETLRINVQTLDTPLSVIVMDWDAVTEDDEIGRASLVLRDHLKPSSLSDPVTIHLPLEPKGELVLELTYIHLS